MEQTLYALKSKKSGWYFKFEQYCDDGYGKYEDNSLAPFDGSDMPYLFNKSALTKNSYVWNMLKDHTSDDVETVEITLTIKE